jgi:hypothetical protein
LGGGGGTDFSSLSSKIAFFFTQAQFMSWEQARGMLGDAHSRVDWRMWTFFLFIQFLLANVWIRSLSFLEL